MPSEYKLIQEYREAFASKFKDAASGGWTHEWVMERFASLRKEYVPSGCRVPQWSRMTSVARASVDGWVESFYAHVIRPRIESGSWVWMPDGTKEYFGVTERLDGSGTRALEKRLEGRDLGGMGVYEYISKHEVEGTGGLYWLPKPDTYHGQLNWGPGEKVWFIPEVKDAKPNN